MYNPLKVLFEEFQERPVAYMPIYSKITGSVTAGVLLSQIVYWDKTKEHNEFFKTDKDFCRELFMGVTELKNAKKTLVKMGIISTKRKSTPAKTFYRLNTKKLIDLITSNVDLSKSVSMKPTNLLVENQPTNTENTTESTIYAPSYQNGANKDTISNYLNNNPPESEDVNKAVQYYLECYADRSKNPHPEITFKQYQKIIKTLLLESEQNDLKLEDFERMIEGWFTDKDVQSNYNIMHFATPGVLKTQFYKNVY